jgi:hypothetical protein
MELASLGEEQEESHCSVYIVVDKIVVHVRNLREVEESANWKENMMIFFSLIHQLSVRSIHASVVSMAAGKRSLPHCRPRSTQSCRRCSRDPSWCLGRGVVRRARKAGR